MVGYELTRTIGEVSATYKFTPKYVLKAGQKVTVRLHFLLVNTQESRYYVASLWYNTVKQS